MKSSPSTRAFFGTDGIRGRVGIDPITPEFCLKLGWAAGKSLTNDNGGLAIIGKDTRISGYLLESAIEAGFVYAGVDVGLLGPIPTPAVAHLTRTLRADIGVVISASHNPFEDNGIKFFDANGGKLEDELEREIEAQLARPMSSTNSVNLGKAHRITDAYGRYIESCKNSVARDINFRGMRLVVDCANGATYRVAPEVFSELGAEVFVIGANPDGLNINYQCGSTNTQALRVAVHNEKADLGIAFDGDGDRVIMVDAEGRDVDGDQLLYAIAMGREVAGVMHGGVVGTVMSNFGLESSLKDSGIPFARANVGDRYVQKLMKEKGWVLGGETSGHIMCLDLTTTGDGIISALQVLVAMRATGSTLSELSGAMFKLPQSLLSIDSANPVAVLDHPDVTKAIQEIERELADSGRLVVRASGTEPMIRIMVEGRDHAIVQFHAQRLARIIRALTPE